MDLDDLIGPLPAPLGRWMLRRMVAGGVRYGHEFSVILVRGADAGALAPVLRGADLFAHWDGGDLLALLPDTDRAGAAAVADRVRAATGAGVGAAHWGGDLAEDLLERAGRALEADLIQPA
jgi:PleD family two-component response regulator